VKTLSAGLVLAAAIAALTACGAPKTAPPAAPAAPPSASVAPVAPQPTQARPQPTQISLTAGRARVAGVDADVVTYQGRTVYRFEADDNRPSKVNCTSDCLTIWPPLLTDGSAVKLSGVDQALVGSVTRDDGLVQVTLSGWPLYLFHEDQAAGETKGEGVGGNWSVIRPDGKPVIKK
jgi:predicted lipoprotein with Yx(FWY)xxD motif